MSQVGFFFYTGDWLKDTRILTLRTQGAWITALCVLWEHEGTVQWPVSAYACLWSVTLEEVEQILEELRSTGVADVKYQNDNKTITKLSCRRMMRWWEKEKQKHIARSEAGKKGMEKRWQRHNKNNTLLNPSLNPSTDSDKEKNKNSSSGVPDFPSEWIWLSDLVKSQNGGFPIERFLDFQWWDAVSYSCGGLSKSFLETEFAKMRRWIMDNPQREPTPRGYRKFVAGWLERAHDKERRFKNAQTAR